MRKFLFAIKLICFVVILSNNCFCQVPNWVNTLGSPGRDEPNSIDFDNLGNIYVTGHFSGTLDFDPGPGVYNLSSNGQLDIFVAKYSESGAFIWAFNIGGILIDAANEIKVNYAGEVIVTGYFRGNVDFDPSPNATILNGVSNTGVDPGFGGDLFLAKYSNNGTFIWAFSVPNTYHQNAGYGFDIDLNDNIYLTGQNNSTSPIVADFDPGPGVYSLSNPTDGHIFIAKYSTGGNFIWAFSLGPWGNNSSGYKLKVDPLDTTFVVTGHLLGVNVDFDPGPGTFILTSNFNDIFVAKYSYNKNFCWAFNMGGPSVDMGGNLDFDTNKNIYLTGFFNGTNIDFDPSPNVLPLNSIGLNDIFVAKYTKNGSAVWAKSIGGIGDDFGWGIKVKQNSVITIGEFRNIVDFDPGGPTFNLTSSGQSDAFISMLDTNGNFQCATSFGDAGNDRTFYMDRDYVDTILVCGHYQNNSVDFDPSPNILLKTNSGNSDVFFGKYYFNQSGNYSVIIVGDTICSGTNPFVSIILNPIFGGTFSVSLTDGLNNYSINNVTSGVPFQINAFPTATTTYTISTIYNLNPSNCSIGSIMINLPVVISVIPPPNINAFANPSTVCLGQSTTLNGIGGISYTWTQGVQNNIPFSPVASNIYTVTGTDIDGCTNTSIVSVLVNGLPNVTANASPNPVCLNGNITLIGGGALNYSWSGGVLNGVPFLASGPNTYTVIGSDANGCTNSSTITLNISPPINVTILPDNPVICKWDSIQLNASGAATYLWANVFGLNDYSSPSVWSYPNTTTTFTVTGTDINGCTGTATALVTVIDSLSLNVVKSFDAECGVNIVQLAASGAENYFWSPSNQVVSPTLNITNVNVYETTTFYLTGTTGSCSANDSITVYYFNNDETGIIIPNAFSPNNDGLNDCFRILHNANFIKYYFCIYNRWGERVFETDDPNFCWNGEHRNKTSDIDTYFYYLMAKTKCGDIFKKGDIILVR